MSTRLTGYDELRVALTGCGLIVRLNALDKIESIVAALLRWYVENARDLPWRRTHDPYAIWVSEIMLQQTQVKTVIPFWERWMRELPKIESLANAPSEQIHKLWEGLGYYTRVRNMQKAAQLIVQKHGGQFPEKFDDVLALPGIGRYTAGAICSIAFHQPAPILDGNVIRVLTRIFGIATDPREKRTNARLWQLAETLVRQAPSDCSSLNQSLMELGALVCTPKNPNCPACPVKKLCAAFRENRVAELPNLGERAKPTARRFAAFVAERAGRFLVRQRPAGVVNAQLWEFPNVEVTGDDVPPPDGCKPLCTIKHSITRYRITLHAFRANGRQAEKFAQRGGKWVKLEDLRKLSFPSAHRKILAALAEAG